jgi:hypothetical protein
MHEYPAAVRPLIELPRWRERGDVELQLSVRIALARYWAARALEPSQGPRSQARIRTNRVDGQAHALALARLLDERFCSDYWVAYATRRLDVSGELSS